MTVIIGMDPDKRSATIEVVDDRGRILAAGCYGTDKGRLRRHARRWAALPRAHLGGGGL